MCIAAPLMQHLPSRMRAAAQPIRTFQPVEGAPLPEKDARVHRNIATPSGRMRASAHRRNLLATMRARVSTRATASRGKLHELSSKSDSAPITFHFPLTMLGTLPLMAQPPPRRIPIRSSMCSRPSTIARPHSPTATDAHGGRLHFCIRETILPGRLCK